MNGDSPHLLFCTDEGAFLTVLFHIELTWTATPPPAEEVENRSYDSCLTSAGAPYSLMTLSEHTMCAHFHFSIIALTAQRGRVAKSKLLMGTRLPY